MGWLSKIFAILKFLPQVMQLIGEVESAIGPGNGAAKKALVMAPIAGAPAEVVSFVDSFVDKVVAAKKQATTPVAPK